MAGSSCLRLPAAVRDVLAAATIGGARACWLEDTTGSLTPGKAVDLLVTRAPRPVITLDQAYGQVVWMGEASRLESVLVNGEEKLVRWARTALPLQHRPALGGEPGLQLTQRVDHQG